MDKKVVDCILVVACVVLGYLAFQHSAVAPASTNGTVGSATVAITATPTQVVATPTAVASEAVVASETKK